MTVRTFVQPDSSTQSETDYPPIVDAAITVLARMGDNFAPHAQAVPDMTVALDPGHLMNGQTLVEVAAQSTGAITAPTTHPRIDRIVIDNVTGAASVVTGTEAASPAPPAIPAGKSPVARVQLETGSTAITNMMLTDERDFGNTGTSAGALLNVHTFTSSGTYTPTAGTQKIIVEVQGGGASGGGCAATGATTVAGASGGGSGAYAKALLSNAGGALAGTTVTVGAGGAAPSAGANDGNDGAASSFGTVVVAGGGGHGRAGFAIAPPFTVGAVGPAGLPTGANIMGGTGTKGGSSFCLALGAVAGGVGADSHYGGGGLAGGNSAGGSAATRGTGGGGASSGANNPARVGGAGADGIVIIFEYA